METRTLSSGRWLLLVLWLGGAQLSQAHLLNMTEARLLVDSEQQQVDLILQIDLLRTAGSPQDYWRLARTPMHAQYQPTWQKLAASIRVMQGDQRLKLTVVQVTAPADRVRSDYFDPLVWPKLQVRLSGSSFDTTSPIRAVFESQFVFEEPIALTLQHGSTRRSRWLISEQASPWLPLSSSHADKPIQVEAFSFEQGIRVAWQGFLHILPGGVDHLMLLLAMLLIATRWQHIVALVSLFTVGHSMTLLAVALRLVELNSVAVEVCILLSISVFAALSLWRVSPRIAYWLILPIGWLHGLGFGSALIELNVTDHLLWNVFVFNVGIEMAQLVFVAALTGLGVLLRSRDLQLVKVRVFTEWLLLVVPLGATLVYLR